VQYVELADQGHLWATKSEINATIWKFFAEHPRQKK
jgi:polyhydroxybutyrate depolymerase